ncbi:MAG TPA: thiamine-phosphate synthase family protein [Candidatus Thermoplasmatota archaeon]|nr:thiamine-phosphate synthase family protein [Candidatus Thermoplasmatota archaeon]
MALPPCFHLADEVFPRVRAQTARRLVEQGWSQMRTAQALGLSQAMVSRHVTAPPPPSDALVDRLASELEKDLLLGSVAEGPSRWCAVLSISPSDEPLQDLLAAERLLRETPPLRVVPQIGLNVARALPGATGPHQVLSFPGRLVDAGGRLVVPAPPELGASGHLARCLLQLRRRDPSAFALASVRGGPAVAKAAIRLGWDVAQVGARRGGAQPEAAVLRAIDKAADPNVIHDPGAVGLEACLYLAGPDARAVAQRILQLDSALVKP